MTPVRNRFPRRRVLPVCATAAAGAAVVGLVAASGGTPRPDRGTCRPPDRPAGRGRRCGGRPRPRRSSPRPAARSPGRPDSCPNDGRYASSRSAKAISANRSAPTPVGGGQQGEDGVRGGGRVGVPEDRPRVLDRRWRPHDAAVRPRRRCAGGSPRRPASAQPPTSTASGPFVIPPSAARTAMSAVAPASARAAAKPTRCSVVVASTFTRTVPPERSAAPPTCTEVGPAGPGVDHQRPVLLPRGSASQQREIAVDFEGNQGRRRDSPWVDSPGFTMPKAVTSPSTPAGPDQRRAGADLDGVHGRRCRLPARRPAGDPRGPAADAQRVRREDGAAVAGEYADRPPKGRPEPPMTVVAPSAWRISPPPSATTNAPSPGFAAVPAAGNSPPSREWSRTERRTRRRGSGRRSRGGRRRRTGRRRPSPSPRRSRRSSRPA